MTSLPVDQLGNLIKNTHIDAQAMLAREFELRNMIDPEFAKLWVCSLMGVCAATLMEVAEMPEVAGALYQLADSIVTK